MKTVISPKAINGSITPPPSKSITQRAYAAALLHNGKTIIQNTGGSADEVAALNIIQQLGASVDCINEDTLIIQSKGLNPTTNEINCNESGLAARLFTPIVALSNTEIVVNGKGSLLTRPMSEHIDTLSTLGVPIQSDNECLPLHITGPIVPDNITVDGSLSSQFLSGLLIAYAFSATKEVSITVDNLVSRPYIDLTLQTLKYFGKSIEHKDYKSFKIIHTEDIADDIYINIENDWSAAATLLVAGAINGDIVLENLNSNSLQADIAVLDILKQSGANIDVSTYSTSIKKADQLTSFNFDASNCPDLFPALSVLAACCNGTSSIKGTNRLVHKESNRLDSITDMLTSFGITYQNENDTLNIIGGRINAATINSHNDHRIVMAAAIGGLVAEGDMVIENTEAVSKSYPDFFAHLSLLGADIEQT